MTATFGSVAVVGCGGGTAGSGEASAAETPAGEGSLAAQSPEWLPTAPAPEPTGERRFTLTSPTTSTAAAFCIGYAFRKGDVPAATSVVADIEHLQVTPKNYWPDGSLKFAVIAGHAPLTANVPLTVNLSAGSTASGSVLSLADLRATGVTAAIECGSFGTAAWSGADWDAPFHVWITGPQMSSWIYRKPVGSDAHLVAWMEVRLFAGGAVEVLPWIENGYLKVAGPTNKSAQYGFVLGGVRRFDMAIDLPNHCRTALVSGGAMSYWLRDDPQVTPKHDTEYLQSTCTVPSYRANVSPTSRVVESLSSAYVPLQQSNHSPGMGSAGYHGSIGLLPEWDVIYLTSTSHKGYAGVIVNALSAGRYGIHFRDERTNRPLRFSEHPTLVLGKGSSITGGGTSPNKNYTPEATGTAPAKWVSSHHPSLGFMAYITTGRWYFMEEVQFAATANYLKNADHTRNFADGLIHSWSASNTTRGAAWALRTLAQAACVTPDADTALRNEFTNSLSANVDWLHARYVATTNNPFGWVRPYSDYTSDGDNVYYEATWMQDFYTAVIGYVRTMDLDLSAGVRQRLAQFFEWKAQSIVGRLGGGGSTEYLFADAAPYTIAVAKSDSPDFMSGAGPWHANWGEIYADTLKSPNPGAASALRGGHFPSATSYWANLQPAIAYAVQHGVPGAEQAYERMTSASNWIEIYAEFDRAPVWSVYPRNRAKGG